MTREEKIDVKVKKIHHHQGEIKALEGGILKLLKFKGFEEEGLDLPFVQEHEDGSVLLVAKDICELELDRACEIMNEVGYITPNNFKI
jgi:hypothetical protein